MSGKSFLEINRTAAQAKLIFDQRISDALEVYSKFSDTFIERDCPICGCKDGASLPDFHNSYQVKRCIRCMTVYVNPCPGVEALIYYYNHCDCNKQFHNLVRNRQIKNLEFITFRESYVFSLVEEMLGHKESVRILEVGCGAGWFLQSLFRRLSDLGLNEKVELFGVDVDQTAVAQYQGTDVKLIAQDAVSYAAESDIQYDLVINFELIEHLPNPRDFMCAMRSILAREGMLFLTTPNGYGVDNRCLGYNQFRPLAHSIFPPMHLQAFTTSNMTHFLIECGFNLVDLSTPGSFDVDIITHFGESSDLNTIISRMEESHPGALQKLIQEFAISSHMQILCSRE